MTKCPECGTDIPDGQMYCSGCGWEVKLVPEFEPEIENKIDKTLSRLADKIDDTEKDIPHPQEKKPSAGKNISRAKKEKHAEMGVGRLLIAACALMIIAVSAFLWHKSAADYQKLSVREAERGNGEAAVSYLDKALEREPKNAELLLLKANYQQELLHDPVSAVDTLYEIINSAAFLDTDLAEAYLQCASIYLEQGDDEALRRLLEQCPFDDVKNAFAAQVQEEPAEEIPEEPEPEPEPVPVPVVLEDSGRYTEPTKIVVHAGNGLEIRYTTDENKTPDAESELYTGPIDMPEGESVFCFVACDEDGRCSETVVRFYTLEAEVNVSPEEAVINVKQALIVAGYMEDLDGRVSGLDGYYAYAVDNTVTIGNDGTFYYIREIHVHADGTQEDTGRLYAVQTETGMTKRLGYDSAGKIMLMHF